MGREQKASTVGAVDPADHVGLVYGIAHPYAKRSGLLVEDLIQEGAIGLSIAAKRFDPTRGIKFSAYAYWWIHHSICRYLNMKSRLVSLPDRRAQKLRQAGELPPTPQSFDAPIGSTTNGHEITLHDVFADERAPNPEDVAAKNERRAIIWREVGKLPKRTRTILKLRFIFGQTLEEIGATLGGISRERVRQLEAEALDILRDRLEAVL